MGKMNFQLLLISTFGIIIVSGLIVKNPVMNRYGMEIYWVDGRERLDDPVTIDTLFDRCVCISTQLDPGVWGKHLYKYFRYEVTGVFITEYQILTSYNAFRSMVNSRLRLERMRVALLIGRYIVNPKRGAYGYYGTTFMAYRYPDCGRQIVPPFELSEQSSDKRHGIHSPMHDLMVLRTTRPVAFVNPPPRHYNFDYYEQYPYYRWYAGLGAYLITGFGPIQTEIADRDDVIGDNNASYASIAHIDDMHIFENRFLEKGNTTGKRRIMVDCDEWVPRDWGYFLCVFNENRYEGIASGAVLFGGLKLFGIGSFSLKKGDESVLVFTDVRPYKHLAMLTCTPNDVYLEVPPAERPWWWIPYLMGDYKLYFEKMLKFILWI